MKWNFLCQITAASRTPEYGATTPRSPFCLSSVLNWICWTLPREKFLGTPLAGIMAFYRAMYFVATFPIAYSRGVQEISVSCAVQDVRARICCQSSSHLQIS